LKQLEEQESKKQQAIAMLAKMGFTLDDLVQSGTQPAAKVKKTKSQREPKYIYTDESGEEKHGLALGAHQKQFRPRWSPGVNSKSF
jgi:DNA-binding protein H-NS